MQQRFERFAPHVELDALLPAVRATKILRRDTPLWADGDHGNALYVVDRGFAFSFSIYPDGRRHISEVYGAGAICNWDRLFHPLAVENVLVRGNAQLTVLDPLILGTVLRGNPKLDSIVRRHELARTLRHAQRTKGLIALPARERLLLALLDIEAETGWALEVPGGALRLPMTFHELADFIGITETHVHRTLQSLQADGAIERKGRSIRIIDRDGVIENLNYQDFCRARAVNPKA